MDEQEPLAAYMTAEEAAQHLGITRQAVVKAIQSGHLHAAKKGTRYLILAEQVETYRANPLRSPRTRGAMGGRPRKPG
jgi:excisionase family DNA binding protein